MPLVVSVMPAPAWRAIWPSPPCWVISSFAALTFASIVTVTVLVLVVRLNFRLSAATWE